LQFEGLPLARPNTARANPALRLALIRRLHVWVSVFVAPSLIFFSVTGALQTFRIPDQKDASVLLVKLARVHKDDVFAVKPAPPPRPQGAGPAGRRPTEAAAPTKPPARPSTQGAKWFFALVSVAVAITTVLGLWMALAYSRDRLWMWILMIAGAAIPIVILAI
jgi:hypothetical protein